MDQLTLAHQGKQDEPERQADGRVRRHRFQLMVHQSDFDGRQGAVFRHEGRDRGRPDVIGRVEDLLAVQDGKPIDLLDDVSHVDGRGRGPLPLTLLQRSGKSSDVISVKRRFLKTGRMSRSRMLLRIERVLSAILAPLARLSVNSWKFFASDRRRFSRCFSCAGDLPSYTARRASMHLSRALANDKPSAP